MSLRKPRIKPQPLGENALYEYAVAALGRRMRTVSELKRLMKSQVEAGEAGEAKMLAVIAHLKEQRYLDDATYAATYTRLRLENNKFGKRRVRQDLTRKGVGSEYIANTLDQSYENIDEENLARQHLEGKRVRQPANEKDSSRIVRLLVRAGFSTGVIFKILKDWKASDKFLAAIETLDSDNDAEPE
jgi:regulatory protein